MGQQCCYWGNNRVIKNPARELFKNISEIPWADWKSINPRRYPPAPHGGLYKRFPIAPVITTRGCPFRCKFCGSKSTWGSDIRYRDKDDVVDEIEFLVNNYGVGEFYFEDDNFTFTKGHAAAICNEIIKRELDIVWSCPNGVRIDTIDKELLGIMKEAGCYLLAFGIESGSQEILDQMEKRLDKRIIYDVLKMVKSAGIETWGAFIIGLPGENKNTVRETLEFAKQLPLDRAQFCNFTPIPGTPLFDLWLKQRKINNLKDVTWSDLNFFGKCVYDIDELSAQELTKLQKKAFFSFYGRPRVFTKMFKKIKFNQFWFMLKRFKAYILK